MKSALKQDNAWKLRGQAGKGTLGCVFSLLLLGLGVIAAIKVLPPYFAHKGFQTDVRTEISRAGANFHDDETVMKNVLALARRNEIRLTRNNVKVERFAGQVHVKVNYSVPVDFIFYKKDMEFEIQASSFIGKL